MSVMLGVIYRSSRGCVSRASKDLMLAHPEQKQVNVMYKNLDLIAVKPVSNNPFVSSVKVFDAVKVDNYGKESPVILYQRVFTEKTPKHVLDIEPSETPLKYNYIN